MSAKLEFKVVKAASVVKAKVTAIEEPKAVKAQSMKENINNWLKALNHANLCTGCTFKNCKIVKDLLNHKELEQCSTNCPECRQRKNLLRAHAKRCTIKDCTIPGCKENRVQLYLELLIHTATDCRDKCSNNCKTMRGYIEHKKICKISDCAQCSKINNLIKLHSEQCTKTLCGVPDCNTIRAGQQDMSVTRCIYIPLLDATKLD